MAGFATHIIFGDEVLGELADPMLSSIVRKHKGVFGTGCQGPDLFLYNVAMLISDHQKNLGSRMHGENTGRFFACLLQMVWERKDILGFEVGLSYFMGILAHYTMDTIIHPFVGARIGYDPEEPCSQKETMPKHHRLESMIDAQMLAVKAQMLPSAYQPEKALELSRLEREVLTEILSEAVGQAYRLKVSKANVRDSLSMMKMAAKSFYFSPDKRKKVYEKVESFFCGRKSRRERKPEYGLAGERAKGFYSNLLVADAYVTKRQVMNLEGKPWRHPWKPEQVSRASVWELYERAVARYAQYVEGIKPLLRRYVTRYLAISHPYYSYEEKEEKTRVAREEQRMRKCLYELRSREEMRKFIRKSVKELGNLSYNTGLPL